MRVRGLTTGVSVILTLVTLGAAPALWRTFVKPPEPSLLLDAYASSVQARRRTSFSLELTDLQHSPPVTFALDSAAHCSSSTIKLVSRSGTSIQLEKPSKDAASMTLESLLWTVLCEPYPVKLLNQQGADLDPAQTTILVDSTSPPSFYYRLGNASTKHAFLELDFTSEYLKGMAFHVSPNPRTYSLFSLNGQASLHDGKLSELSYAISKNKRLAWRVKLSF